MIDKAIEKYAILITKAIDTYLPIDYPEGLYEASRHLVEAGGKRLRPTMFLLAADAAGGKIETLVSAALSIELIHNFTLIHDDIMDNAELRRGKKSVHMIWGTSEAILVGDTLYSKAFQTLGMTQVEASRLITAMNILSRTATSICEGQWMDLEFEDRDDVSEKEYMTMIEKKTGVLYGASASMGATLSGASEEFVRGLDEFGRFTGMGFQIHDDVLDLTSTTSALGKRRGGDLIEGKKTLIMIHAKKHGLKLSAFGKKDATQQELEENLGLLQNGGSIDYARERAEMLVKRGKRALDILPDTQAKTLMLDLADYMIYRKY
ncbi:MAG: polyprenyl synthetase family protein [Methanotrichaceae archaeon]|nr:polyprenyl synthetase family protein [Methanotrichaceae archaeon]